MKKKLLGWLIPLCLLAGHSIAQKIECHTIIPTQATGYGSVEARTTANFGDALAAAMTNAISQVLGVFVSSKRELTDYMSNVITNGTHRIESVTEFKEVIYTQFSGVIVDYEVISSTTTNGVLELTISANICADPRIALIDNGSPLISEALIASLTSNVADLGWRVVPIRGYYGGLSRDDLLAIGLETGGTFVLVNDLFSTYQGQWRGLEQWSVSLTSLLYDIRSLNTLDSLSISQDAVGATADEAQREAAAILANKLIQNLTRRFSNPSGRLVGDILFRNVKRPGSRFDIEETLSGIGGVISVTRLTYNPENRTVRATLELSKNLCEVAENFTSNRSFLSQLTTCSEHLAEIWVQRD